MAKVGNRRDFIKTLIRKHRIHIRRDGRQFKSAPETKPPFLGGFFLVNFQFINKEIQALASPV